jgi:hypothetical protein
VCERKRKKLTTFLKDLTILRDVEDSEPSPVAFTITAAPFCLSAM